jgi:nucleotide-binding universal stress UspA family protein
MVGSDVRKDDAYMTPTDPASGPLLICYDGSENAKQAITSAGSLLAGRNATVVTVWQPRGEDGSLASSGAMDSLIDFTGIDRATAEGAEQLADEGVQLAQEAGIEAVATATRAVGPVWKTLLAQADEHDASVIVLGSRGLGSLRSALRGSVSSAVMHHAQRPTLVVHDRPVPSPLPEQTASGSRES